MEGAPVVYPLFLFMKNRHLLLLLPLFTLTGYLLTNSFLLRSGTTLLCLFIIIFTYTWPGVVRSATFFVATSLLLSFLGDFVLGHWGSSFEGFICGVSLFLMAHLGYMAYCLCHGNMRWGWLSLLAIVFGAGYYGVLLRPRIGDIVTSCAVMVYVLVSCLSMAAALGLNEEAEKFSSSAISGKSINYRSSETSALPFRTRFLFATGIACLLFSDLLIAQKRFLGDGTLYTLMMPTYFASQLLVTAYMLTNTRLQ